MSFCFHCNLDTFDVKMNIIFVRSVVIFDYLKYQILVIKYVFTIENIPLEHDFEEQIVQGL